MVVEVLFSEIEHVPDWHYMSDFAGDNKQYKPTSCGFEGWLWLKGPHDHSFVMRWVFLRTDPEPAVCYLDDIDSEFGIMKAATTGDGGKALARKLVTIKRDAPSSCIQARCANSWEARRQWTQTWARRCRSLSSRSG